MSLSAGVQMERAAIAAGQLRVEMLQDAYVEALDGKGITPGEQQVIGKALDRLISNTDVEVPKSVVDAHAEMQKRLAQVPRGSKPTEGEIQSWLGVQTVGDSLALPSQEFGSAGTSQKQVARIFKWLAKPNKRNGAGHVWQPGTVNADIGGGRYDLATAFLAKEHGVENLIYDPPQDLEAAEKVYARLLEEPAHTATIANVLNVIKEPEVRDDVISRAATILRAGGTAYFQVWERNKHGKGEETRAGWQNNAKTETYVDEVAKHFDHVELLRLDGDSGLIIATDPKNKGEDLDALQIEAYRAGAGKRSTKFDRESPVGKSMGQQTWVHRDYEGVFPKKALERAKSALPQDFDYAVVRYDPSNGAFAFLQSPDFDSADEPTVGPSALVKKDGTLKVTQPPRDPLIWHHKWMFVRDDYAGFNIAESMRRSIHWKSIVGTNKAVSNQIGRKSYWESEILPKL